MPPTGPLSRLGTALGYGAAIAGASMATEKLIGLAQRAWQANKFTKLYLDMLAANPDLKKEDAQKVMARFRVLHRFGPDVAADPIVAGSWIRQTLEFPVITPTVLRDVVEVQQRTRDIARGGDRGGPGSLLGTHMSKTLLSGALLDS